MIPFLMIFFDNFPQHRFFASPRSVGLVDETVLGAGRRQPSFSMAIPIGEVDDYWMILMNLVT